MSAENETTSHERLRSKWDRYWRQRSPEDATPEAESLRAALMAIDALGAVAEIVNMTNLAGMLEFCAAAELHFGEPKSDLLDDVGLVLRATNDLVPDRLRELADRLVEAAQPFGTR